MSGGNSVDGESDCFSVGGVDVAAVVAIGPALCGSLIFTGVSSSRFFGGVGGATLTARGGLTGGKTRFIEGTGSVG